MHACIACENVSKGKKLRCGKRMYNGASVESFLDHRSRTPGLRALPPSTLFPSHCRTHVCIPLLYSTFTTASICFINVSDTDLAASFNGSDNKTIYARVPKLHALFSLPYFRSIAKQIYVVDVWGRGAPMSQKFGSGRLLAIYVCHVTCS
jgi:hypothetical protein